MAIAWSTAAVSRSKQASRCAASVNRAASQSAAACCGGSPRRDRARAFAALVPVSAKAAAISREIACSHEFPQSCWLSTYAGASRTAQASAVAKLIQRFDNLPGTRLASVASLSTLHLSQGAVRQSCVCRSTAAVPSRAASEGEDFNEARFPSALAHDHPLGWCRHGRHACVCAGDAAGMPAGTFRTRRAIRRHVRDGTQPETRGQPTVSVDATRRASRSELRAGHRHHRLAHSAAEPDLGQPGDGAVEPGSQASGHDPHRGSDQLAAAVVRGPGFEHFERRDRYRDGQPSRPRLEAHPGADQRPSSAAGRSARPRSPDINFVPATLIKRVDVLTGGASSVYGADAVAGVVNFIMDTTFRGLRIDAQASDVHALTIDAGQRASSTPNDGRAASVPPHGMSTNGGAQDIAGVVRRRVRRRPRQRHGLCDLSPAGRGARSRAATIRSARSAPIRAAHSRHTASLYCGGSCDLGRKAAFACSIRRRHAAVQRHVVTATSSFRARRCSTSRRTTTSSARTSATRSARSPNMRSARAAKPYLEAMFMNDHTDAQIAPSGNFGNTTYVNCDNPLLSAQELDIICRRATSFTNPALVNRQPVCHRKLASVLIGRRNVEGGGRDDDLEHTAWRIVAGIRGDLLKGLSYDAYYQFGTTPRSADLTTTTSRSRACNRASSTSVTDPGTGLPVCRSVLTGDDPNCVPYNIFTTGGVTPAALDYLQIPALPARQRQRDHRPRRLHVHGGEYGVADAVVGHRHRPQRRRRVSQGGARLPARPRIPAAAISPARAVRLSGPRPVRRSRNVRRVQVPIVEPQFHRGAERQRRLSLLGLQGRAIDTTSTPTRTSCRSSSLRSTTSASAPATTARFARRTSSNCSSPPASALGGTDDPCASAGRHRRRSRWRSASTPA